MDQDIKFSIDVVTELENDIKLNKKEVQKFEEVLLKISKITEEDISQFRDFLKVAKTIIDADDFEDGLKSKLTEIDENKKIDPAFKQTLKILCVNKGFIIN